MISLALLIPSISATIKIQPPRPPLADFFWTPEDPQADQEITFNASPSNAFHEYEIVSYDWDLNGDGICKDACGIVSCYCYHTQKECKITLIVTDNQGQTGKKTKNPGS